MIQAVSPAKWSASGGVRKIEFGADQPLLLSSGARIAPLTIAFETYGQLNDDKSNAILVCHALTGDQFVASPNPMTGRPAWWPRIVGPGLPIDTNRFFVICPNVLGGCMGTTGPSSLAANGAPYGLTFPAFTVADMVRAQAMLLEALGVHSLFCVIGGSIGGMQALQCRDRDGGAAFGAEHRLLRGRPSGDHGRSRLARRRLPGRGRASGERPRRRADGGAHHLSLGEFAQAEV
jgi:homoserine O-acetyltransferase